MNLKKMIPIAAVFVVALAIVAMSGCKDKAPTAMSGHAGHAMAQFANAKCPIMGSTITPDKVTADLTREFKGEKVAFCCAGCPDKWDALSEDQKTTKLAAAK